MEKLNDIYSLFVWGLCKAVNSDTMSVYTREVCKRFAVLKEKKSSSSHVPRCPDMPDGMFPRLIGFISHHHLEKEPVENVWKGEAH